MNLKKLIKRLVTFVTGKPQKPVRIYTHFYFNHNDQIVMGIIEKSDRSVVFVRNENDCVVKLKTSDVHKFL